MALVVHYSWSINGLVAPHIGRILSLNPNIEIYSITFTKISEYFITYINTAPLNVSLKQIKHVETKNQVYIINTEINKRRSIINSKSNCKSINIYIIKDIYA